MVSVTQMTSSYDKEANFEICENLFQQASEKNSEFIFFPENFLVVGTGPQDVPKNAETIDSDLVKEYLKLAEKYNMFVSYGGFYEYDPSVEKFFNTHLVVNNLGEILAKYRKIHLFDIDLPDLQFQESMHVEYGDTFVVCEDTPVGTCGVSTCYDLRFGEMYTYHSNYLDAETLLIPASNSVPTGQAHWHVLMRSRAIENQCYVIASAQTGRIDDQRHPTFGHALVVDPFGKVLLDIPENETNCVKTIEIDMEYVEKVREYMPCRSHRHKDLYKIEYFGK